MRKLLTLTLALVMGGIAMPAAAEKWPDRPIKIINPFPSGPTDIFARLVARDLQAALEQPVIVDGKPGAGGMIAVSFVAKAPPDGYTLLITSASTQIVQPVVRKSVPYDTEKDFIPIASTGMTPQLIVVHPSIPVSNLKELVDYAKSSPVSMSYSSSGNGTALHMAGEVFANVAGVKLTHVPYKSAAPAVTDLLGGQVQMMFDSVANAGPHIRSGKLKGIAVMGSERVPALPDLKTTAELGMPAMRFYNFLGIYAPAGTPPEIVERIAKVLRTSLNGPKAREFYESAGMPPTPVFGPELVQASRVQRRDLADLVKKANLPLAD